MYFALRARSGLRVLLFMAELKCISMHSEQALSEKGELEVKFVVALGFQHTVFLRL